MDGRCTECNNHNVALHHYQKHLCYNCYENLFTNAKIPNPFEDEDFVLEHDTAIIKPNHNDMVVLYSVDKGLVLTNPKRYVFDPSCRVKDYDKLVLFLLENFTIYDNAKGFDKVSYMFKEVK